MSKLEKFRLSFEYHPDQPDILKAIRRAKRARKQRREAQMAKSSQRKIPLEKQASRKETK